MAKRTTTQRSEKERIALLKQWKSHPQWTAGDAARELQVNVRMLNDWKKRYWDGLDTATGSDRVRGEGGGRPRTKKPYEDNILQFYNRCRRDGIRCGAKELVLFCRDLQQFVEDKPNKRSQRSWVREFLKFYSKMAVGSFTDATIVVGDFSGEGSMASVVGDLGDGEVSTTSAVGDVDSGCSGVGDLGGGEGSMASVEGDLGGGEGSTASVMDDLGGGGTGVGDLGGGEGSTASEMDDLGGAEGSTASEMDDLGGGEGSTASEMDDLGGAEGSTASEMDDLGGGEGSTASVMDDLGGGEDMDELASESESSDSGDSLFELDAPAKPSVVLPPAQGFFLERDFPKNKKFLSGPMETTI